MSKIIHFSEETEITIKDVVDSMTDLQREAMYGIIGKVWTAEMLLCLFTTLLSWVILR